MAYEFNREKIWNEVFNNIGMDTEEEDKIAAYILSDNSIEYEFDGYFNVYNTTEDELICAFGEHGFITRACYHIYMFEEVTSLTILYKDGTELAEITIKEEDTVYRNDEY